MRVESSVTAVSWIPSEAITGLARVPFEIGVTHYDDPPPEVLTDVRELIAKDAIREANELRAWIEVENGRITSYGHAGRGHIGVTKVRVGRKELSFPAVPLPTLRPDSEVGDDHVTFFQISGGRTRLPAPRRVKHPPFLRVTSALAWSSLSLTIRTDGTSEHAVLATGPFPRYWIYDTSGRLVAKTGLMDFKAWYQEDYSRQTPWGAEDSPALIAEVESALERALSARIMRSGTKPAMRSIAQGETLVEQGDEGREIFLLLDGILVVQVDGREVSEVGPGAILGERALLEGGRRTSTLRARTPCRVAVASGDQIDEESLEKLAETHRRESEP